jgi:hypothetical protein
MKPEEIKDLIINSLSADADSGESQRILEDEGLSYSFRPDFRERVLDRLFTNGIVINREREFQKTWNLAFYRIALTGVAAIVILLISIYISEGSFSLDSLLGVSSGTEESIVSLLTGN